ncbi:MAG: hypothetical protein ACKO96_26570 [Flammeovirgaceae bacterium]
MKLSEAWKYDLNKIDQYEKFINKHKKKKEAEIEEELKKLKDDDEKDGIYL